MPTRPNMWHNLKDKFGMVKQEINDEPLAHEMEMAGNQK